MCALFPSSLIAQSPTIKRPSHRINGIVQDATTKEALPFATVGLFKKVYDRDSLVRGVTANENGEFVMLNVASGEIKIQISFIGYGVFEKMLLVKENTDLGVISLQQDAKQLKEVVVTGEKDIVSMSMEKRVFNVSKNITTTGGTAENLLRNVPSLTIDTDGTAKLRNATTTIYINGKPTQLSLSQIPANQIESVEVLSNPSAKYDASASSGIVNLVLKKNRNPGYNGSASVGIGMNSRFDGMVNLERNKGKWNLGLLYNVNATRNPLNNYAYRTTRSSDGTPQSYFSQNTAVNLDNIFQNGRITADYSLNKNNNFSTAGTFVVGQYNSITNQQYTNTDANYAVTSNGIRTTRPDNRYTNAGMEFDWKHSFKQKGRTLSVTSGYNRNWVSNEDRWETTAVNADGTNQPGYPESDHITGQTTGDQLTAQIDYAHPINDSTRWEMGVRSFTYIRDQKYFFNQYNDSIDSYELLPTYSQNAHITETVNALYALYLRKLRHHISLQAGLRVEQSALRGISRFEPSSTFGYDYPSANGKNFIKAFFPSFSIAKKINESSEIGFNISRKIGRPGWRQFFVGIQSSDRQNVTIGNPALQPEFVNTAEVNYSKTMGNANWLSSIYYIYEDNTIKPFVEPSATDPSVYVTSYTNVKADIRAGLDNTFTTVVWKNLNVLINVNAFNVVLQTDTYKRTLWAYNAKVNLGYNFPANLSVQLSTANSSLTPQLQGSRSAVRAADFALRKSFWNNRGSVVFMINDIFNSRKQVIIYDQLSAYQESMNRREVRFYKVTLQIPLGRIDAPAKRKKDSKIARPDVDFSN